MLCAQTGCQLSISGMLMHLSILLPAALHGGYPCYAKAREVCGFLRNFRLTVCDDNEATIKIALERRSLAMRHISRTQRVNLDWGYASFQRPEISLRCVITASHFADVVTKHFAQREVWDALLTVFFLLERIDRSFSGVAGSHSITPQKSTAHNTPLSGGPKS